MNTLCHQMVIPGQDRLEANIALRCSHVHTHIFVCIFMYTYIYLCVCVCVCLCVIYLCMYLYVDISAVYIVCVHTYRPRPAGGHHPALRGAYSAVVVAATRPDAPESALKLCPPHPPGPRRDRGQHSAGMPAGYAGRPGNMAHIHAIMNICISCTHTLTHSLSHTGDPASRPGTSGVQLWRRQRQRHWRQRRHHHQRRRQRDERCFAAEGGGDA